MEQNWYNLSEAETLEKLGSGKKGLSSEEAASRRAKYGKNVLGEEKKPSLFALFLSQFTDLMTLLLIGSAAVSGVVAAITKDGSDLVDTFIIVFIIFLNAVVGFAQQYRADKAIDKLKKLSEVEAKVYRDGQLVRLPSSEITVGDIIELKSGDIVPADCRILEQDNFACDESSLTGENQACAKTNAKLSGKKGIHARRNMAFSSTFAVSGRALCVVTGVGAETEIGIIARSISHEKPPASPLEKSLDILGKIITLSVIAVAVVVFICSLIQRPTGIIASFMSAVAVAVAAIPEGLPAVVTIIMAMGVQKMSKARVVIRKLRSVETLGSCSCICSDKTGTLTENKMHVEKVWLAGGADNIAAPCDVNRFYECASLCHSVAGEYPDIVGDATEKAIIEYLHGRGVNYSRDVSETLPFSSERRMMSVKKGETAYHKGGFDVILSRCSRYLLNGREYAMTAEKRAEIMRECEKMASGALRVIAFAYSSAPGKIVERDMIFIAVAGFFDPPKKGAKQAVEECKRAGIRVVMITGDHLATAAAAAKRIGITGDAVTGEQLEDTPPKQRGQLISRCGVFARVSPSQKREIVDALQNNGQVVAMTGDGINDAPGLKKADIGVAMGQSGADVTKNAADMVIADDDFCTIVGAVKEGRRIFANIRKTITFFLATNAAEVLTVLLASIALIGYDFLRPTQLLWINLVTDSFPVLAFGMEKADDDVMLRPPVSAVKSLWNARTAADIIVFGLVQTILTLGAFAIGLATSGNETAVTMAFLTMSFAELIHSLNVRSDKSALKNHFKGNFTLFVTVFAAIGLSIALCYIPAAAAAFGLVGLNAVQWGTVALLSFAMLPLGDLYKLCLNVLRRKKESRTEEKKPKAKKPRVRLKSGAVNASEKH